MASHEAHETSSSTFELKPLPNPPGSGTPSFETESNGASLSKVHVVDVGKVDVRRVQRLQLRWSEVSHIVQIKGKRGASTTGSIPVVEKVVLDNVSGSANPGQLLSIMGPSGGGKTSMLNVLAGRIVPAKGTVRLNGQPLPRNFNRIAAYVMQEDLLSEMLTPRELLTFAANMRLAEYTPAQRYAQVEYLIRILGLSRCSNTRVGRPLERGLSGGERKRTSIGYELITDPSLIFLDEPTSGLDSFTAFSVLETLKALASQGRTVICTIHQPSSEIFQLFDRLILLSGGRVCFNGKATDAVEAFAAQGFPCPKYSNPADYFMRILHNHSAEDKARVEQLVTYHRSRADASTGLLLHQESTRALAASLEDDGEQVVAKISKPMKGPGAWKEMWYLSQRSFISLVRNPITLNARVASNLAIALVAGIIFFDLENNQRSIQDRVGALFFVVMSQVMSSTMSVVLTFPLERQLLVREQNSGMYRIWTYFFGRTSTDLALNILFPLLFSLVLYWFIGFVNSASQFFIFFATLWLAVNAASSMGLFLGSSLPNPEAAVTLTPVILIPFILFGGLFASVDMLVWLQRRARERLDQSADLNTIGPWLSWLQWLSIFRYAFQALAINELTGFTFVCDPDELIQVGPQQICPVTSGEQVLRLLGLDGQELWFPMVMLLLMTVLFRVLGLISLYIRTRSVQRKN